MSAEFDKLREEVAQTTSSVDSVLTLVSGLAQQIRDNVENKDGLLGLANDLDAQQGRIAAAIEANTPQPPAPTEPAPETPVEDAPVGDGVEEAPVDEAPEDEN